MIEHHTFKVTRTAHVYTSGDLSSNTKYIWLACHGYGQLAEKFIYKFEQLDKKEHFVIAPEGLSKFYWGGVTGNAVASWMTKRHRKNEIEDYVNYLHSVFQRFKTQASKDIEPIFFGFSQGTATVLRYLLKYQPEFSHIILWAGAFPKDVDFLGEAGYLQSGNIHLIYGDEDEYLTPELLEKESNFIDDQRLQVYRHIFKGPHRIDKNVLLQYVDKILQ